MPQEAAIWNTLGVASYRVEDWKAAIEALDTSMRLSSGGTPADWLFLAMAHWQQGETDQARSWYAKAVATLEREAPKDRDLARFRAEAEALIGPAGDKVAPQVPFPDR